MAIITLPPAARIQDLEWDLDRPAQVNRSDWTKRRQVVFQPGPSIWTATCDLCVVIGEAGFLEVQAFLVDLEGQVNSFRLTAVENAQAPSALTPVVNGSGQSGRQLILRGGVPGVTMLRGHKMTVNDQMVMLMASVTFDQDGAATVQFKPSLRLSPADGAAVEMRRPTVLVSLAASQVGWKVSSDQSYQAKQLSLEEAF